MLGPAYNPETAKKLILMDKDQAAQKLHFVSDHFVSESRRSKYAVLGTRPSTVHAYTYNVLLNMIYILLWATRQHLLFSSVFVDGDEDSSEK